MRVIVAGLALLGSGCSIFVPVKQRIEVVAPADAEILVDGELVGTGSQALMLRRNKPHVIEGRLPHHVAAERLYPVESATRTIDAVAGAFLIFPWIGLAAPGACDLKPTQVYLRFPGAPKPPPVVEDITIETEVLSEPPGARIEVDGEYVGDAPITVTWTGPTGRFSIPHVMRAFPIREGHFSQTKFFNADQRIPRRVFFDVRLVPVEAAPAARLEPVRGDPPPRETPPPSEAPPPAGPRDS